MKITNLLVATSILLLPSIAQAADLTGVAKIRDGDQIQIGSSRIRLGGIDAPSAWRVRNKKTAILGAAKPPPNAHATLLASASGPVAPSPDCTIKGNVNSAGECIYHRPTSRWYAQIKMQINKGTRWFCSVED